MKDRNGKELQVGDVVLDHIEEPTYWGAVWVIDRIRFGVIYMTGDLGKSLTASPELLEIIGSVRDE